MNPGKSPPPTASAFCTSCFRGRPSRLPGLLAPLTFALFACLPGPGSIELGKLKDFSGHTCWEAWAQAEHPAACSPQLLPRPSPGLFNALPAPSAPRLALGSWGFCPFPRASQALSPTPLAEVSALGDALLPFGSLIPSGRSSPALLTSLMFAHDPSVPLLAPPFPQLWVLSLVAR